MSSFLFPDLLDDPFPPDAPTAALPGTREKIDVMASRARCRQQLWHALDADDPLRRAKVPAFVGRNGRLGELLPIDI